MTERSEMAFNGNLHEFGIVALLQLPNTNRLNGKLTVDGPGGLAEFYYNGGKLLHAVCGDVQGREALSAIIDWDEGKFAFESDIACEESTITGDLHHVLMWALKERDERKKKEAEMEAAEAERRKLQAEAAAEAEPEPEIEPVIIPAEFLQAASHSNYACIVDNRGNIVAHSHAEEEFIGNIENYLIAVRSYIREYPEGVMGKTFIDDREFSLGLCGNPQGYAVVLFAAPNTRLGILSMELGKFMSELETRGFGERYEGRGK